MTGRGFLSPVSFETHMRPKGQRPTKEPLAGSTYTMPLGFDRTNGGHEGWRHLPDGLPLSASVSSRVTSTPNLSGILYVSLW